MSTGSGDLRKWSRKATGGFPISGNTATSSFLSVLDDENVLSGSNAASLNIALGSVVSTSYGGAFYM